MQSKIKLVHITSSLKVGGAETILCTLLEKLPNDRFEHYVIYFHDGPMRARIESLGVSTYHVEGALILYDPLFFLRLYRCIKKINPDRIHALLWAANIASRVSGWLLKIPVICGYHNNVDQDGYVRNFFDRWTISLAHNIIAVSDEVAETIQRNAPCVQKNAIQVIKNGVNRSNIIQQSNKQRVSREQLGLTTQHVIIGSVGRFVAVKNYSLLLHAFAQLYKQAPHALLMLVGQGPEEAALRQLARTLSIADAVLFIVGKQALGYYPLFDIFVQSSDKEGISMALLEAMSLGVPCIATNRDKFHSVIINDNNGLLVPAGNSMLVADAVLKIMNDQPLACKLVKNAYDVLRTDFDQRVMVSAYQHVFEMMS